MSMPSDDSSATASLAPRAQPTWAQRWCGGAWPLVALIASIALFTIFPSIDLVVSRWFVEADGAFIWQHDPLIARIHEAIAISSRAVAICLVIALAAASVFAKRWPVLALRRRAWGYVFVVLAIGPGLIVNALLKEHWGRARPAQVEPFGGPKRFTAPLQPTDQCVRNCSFTSGHVAYAAMPVTGFFIASTRRRRRAWLTLGLLLAIAVAAMRIAMGGHFLSDTVFSMLITWFTAAACAAIILRPRRHEGLSR